MTVPGRDPRYDVLFESVAIEPGCPELLSVCHPAAGACEQADAESL